MSSKKPEKTPVDANLAIKLQLCFTKLKDQTAKLVTADYCNEDHVQLPRLAGFLRWLASKDPRRFNSQLLFTGSRRYSANIRPDSDFDLVIVINPAEKIRFAEFADTVTEEYSEYETAAKDYHTNGLSHIAYRIGPLNLICVTTEIQWLAWYRGTRETLKIAEENARLFGIWGINQRQTACRLIEGELRKMRHVYPHPKMKRFPISFNGKN